MLILPAVCRTFSLFLTVLDLTDFQNFPRPVAFFQNFWVPVNAIIKFQDFPGFPGPVQTLVIAKTHYLTTLGLRSLQKVYQSLGQCCIVISGSFAKLKFTNKGITECLQILYAF